MDCGLGSRVTKKNIRNGISEMGEGVAGLRSQSVQCGQSIHSLASKGSLENLQPGPWTVVRDLEAPGKIFEMGFPKWDFRNGRRL